MVTTTVLYILEDELHAEHIGEFPTREAASAEARRRMALPWDSPENRAPCSSWRRCGRRLELVMYDDSGRELSREPVVEISAEGVRWATGQVP
jgi:hypothetical protein